MAFLLARPTPRNVNHDNDRFSMFNKERDIPRSNDELIHRCGFLEPGLSCDACVPILDGD
jgi:hypothetical protein